MAKSTKSNTRRGRARLNHRRLVLLEGVLLLGLAESALQAYVLAETRISEPLRVVLAMALMAGMLGGGALLLHRGLVRSMKAGHEVVQALPLPTPVWLIHPLVLAALVYGFALFWGFDPSDWRL